MRDHNDIRYKIKKVEKPSDKVFMLIQVWSALPSISYLPDASKAVLGGVNLSAPEYKNGDNQPHLEAFSVFRHLGRILKGTPLHVRCALYLTM